MGTHPREVAMKKRLSLAGMAIAVSITLASLIFLTAHAEAAELKWVGCGITKKAFMKELAAAYEKKTGTKIIIKGGGATKGVRAMAKGADIGGTCRHKIDVPAEKAAKLHHVAWDALVVVVKKDNPVDSITSGQVKDVLTGRIKNLKKLGGSDSPINLYVRKGKISGVGLMTREMVFNNPDQDFSPKAILKKSSGPLEKAISEDPQGIGITGISSAKKRTKLKMIKVDGVAPIKENIMAGKYPFYRPLYLTTKGEPTGEIRKFIDFALSAEGQAIISEQGTVNLKEGKGLKVK
jgi:phosphate transport system substrate-binding protein